MRKGQGAMEYLMTYGWALLVIIIVGAALFALGILNPATYQQKRCNGFQYFTYMDQAATEENFTIHLRNGVNDINITKVKVSGTTVNVFDPTTTAFNGDNVTATVDGNAWSGGIWVSQGKEVTLNVGTAAAGGVGLGLVPGAYDDLEVIITYNVKNGIQGNTDTAECVGNVV
jgi:hypothetical protein